MELTAKPNATTNNAHNDYTANNAHDDHTISDSDLNASDPDVESYDDSGKVLENCHRPRVLTPGILHC